MGKKTAQPRQVAVSIPYSISADGTKMICLVSSRKHKDRYVLPKGGVDEGETSRQAAIRELWEEAGLKPVEDADPSSQDSTKGTTTNTILDHKAHHKSPTNDPSKEDFVARAVYESHEVRVAQGDPKSEYSDWLEKEERIRKWFTIPEAIEATEWRRDIHQLLLQSSLVQ